MTSILLAAAISGIVSSASVSTQAPSLGIDLGVAGADPLDETKGKHDCKGKNACKGQGGCKSDKHDCKGKNACKGQGGCKGS